MDIIKKYWKWIVGVTIILLILVGYWRYTKQQAFYEKVKKLMEVGIFEEEKFKEIDIESTNIVSNNTDKDFYGDIILVGLNELGIDSVVVTVRPITQTAKDNFDINTELKAHIIGKDDRYVIWVDNLSRYEAITVLSHELIHLVQYQNREIILEKDFVIWKGKQYTYRDIEAMEYRQRPWEADAFSKDKKLKFKLEDILYE